MHVQSSMNDIWIGMDTENYTNAHTIDEHKLGSVEVECHTFEDKNVIFF